MIPARRLYSKDRKGTLWTGVTLLFRPERAARTQHADHVGVGDAVPSLPSPWSPSLPSSSSSSSSPLLSLSSSSFSSPVERESLGFTSGARNGRFTIHKTTRWIELSSLALRQLPVPSAAGRARICIIPFASTILIGGLFQSLSLRIFAFARCSTSPPAHRYPPSSSPVTPPLS